MTQLSAKNWHELREGWGLEEVPAGLREDMACCMCGVYYPRGKLYTDRPIRAYTTLREYQQCIDRMRPNCYCRYHAEQMFGEREGVSCV